MLIVYRTNKMRIGLFSLVPLVFFPLSATEDLSCILYMVKFHKRSHCVPCVKNNLPTRNGNLIMQFSRSCVNYANAAGHVSVFVWVKFKISCNFLAHSSTCSLKIFWKLLMQFEVVFFRSLDLACFSMYKKRSNINTE